MAKDKYIYEITVTIRDPNNYQCAVFYERAERDDYDTRFLEKLLYQLRSFKEYIETWSV